MLPREKFFQKGIDNLSDSDLVGALIGSGIVGIGFQEVSRNVVSKLRRLVKRGEIAYNDLTDVKGIGSAKAVQIICGIELGRRLYSDSDQKVIFSVEDVVYEAREISSRKKEYLMALFLNAKYELISKEIVGLGTVNSVSILPRDILIPALECNSVGIILVHNHPSGNLEPSRDDILVTKNIKKACELVGFELLDHIIVAGNNWRPIDLKL